MQSSPQNVLSTGDLIRPKTRVFRHSVVNGSAKFHVFQSSFSKEISFSLTANEPGTLKNTNNGALKTTLCVTPLLLLLLLNTASDANETDENKDDVYKLCVQLAVDLLDAVEMIDIVLDEKEHNYGISQGFGIAMITVACISFLLSLWPMIETKLHGRKKTISAISRNATEIVLVNGPFLVIRLVIVFSYGKDESIFVAKNVIAIILSVLEIRDELTQ